MFDSYNAGVDCTTCTKRDKCSVRGGAGDKCEYGEWDETLSMLLEQTRSMNPLFANRIGAVLRRELAEKGANNGK